MHGMIWVTMGRFGRQWNRCCWVTQRCPPDRPRLSLTGGGLKEWLRTLVARGRGRCSLPQPVAWPSSRERAASPPSSRERAANPPSSRERAANPPSSRKRAANPPSSRERAANPPSSRERAANPLPRATLRPIPARRTHDARARPTKRNSAECSHHMRQFTDPNCWNVPKIRELSQHQAASLTERAFPPMFESCGDGNMLRRLMMTTAAVALLAGPAMAQTPDQKQSPPAATAPAATATKGQIITEQKPHPVVTTKFN